MRDQLLNALVRILADIDHRLAKAEGIVADPDDEFQQLALDLLIEFQDTKRHVESKLADCKSLLVT